MNLTQLKNELIKNMTPYVNVPLFPADENRPKPKTSHVTYKLTTNQAEGVGYPQEIEHNVANELKFSQTVENLTTISFTTYDKDEDVSRELALHVLDYFMFYGYDFLDSVGAVVHNITNVTNRDVFLVEEYERRNGFDVIIRWNENKIRTLDYFDKIDLRV